MKKSVHLLVLLFVLCFNCEVFAGSDSWVYRADSVAYDENDRQGIYLKVTYIPEGSANNAEKITAMEYVRGLPADVTARNYGGFQPPGVTGVSYLVADADSISFRIGKNSTSTKFYDLICSSASFYALGSVQSRSAAIQALQPDLSGFFIDKIVSLAFIYVFFQRLAVVILLAVGLGLSILILYRAWLALRAFLFGSLGNGSD